jgi:lysosomal acid lipase/cholesteryl ester hydrolase
MDHRYSIIIVVIIAVSLPIGQSSNPPLTPIQLITTNKYVAEEHKVTTRDGYILSMQRIPYGRSGKPNGTQPVIFLQHGLLCSSTNWISNGPKDSLAFMLADAGFDVWLGNIRGNTFSRSHVRYNPDKDKEFWEFSFDEHSQIDLPAMVDHALSVSQQDSLYYVGHSQGTMMGFAGLTYNQTFAKSIKEFFALAPVSTVGDIKGLFDYLAENYKIILPFLDIFGVGEFVPNQGIIDKFGELFCHSVIDEICSNVLFLICGSDAKNLNDSLLPLYLSHAPAGTSVQNVKHWSQVMQYNTHYSGRHCFLFV